MSLRDVVCLAGMVVGLGLVITSLALAAGSTEIRMAGIFLLVAGFCVIVRIPLPKNWR